MRLTNKSYKQYGKVSRYNNFPYYYDKENNKYVYGVTAYLNNTTDSIIHTVKKGDTYDSISLQYYRNPTYYWIICSYNRVQDPYSLPEEGTQLRIPTVSNAVFDDDN